MRGEEGKLIRERKTKKTFVSRRGKKLGERKIIFYESRKGKGDISSLLTWKGKGG